MKNKIKKMSVKEFRARGYLQELNRRFLHPLGMALEVNVDDKTNEETFGEIWDSRNDSEGIIFHNSCIDDKFIKSAKDFDKLIEKKSKTRLEKLGYLIQPIDEKTE